MQEGVAVLPVGGFLLEQILIPFFSLHENEERKG